ncbi:chromate transporter [Peptoniphilus sp. GNH]|nr:chromate transporter [Peptoniphilus sp. GNH]
MEKKISLAKLFFTFFKVNAITFGGGYTIVPVLKDIFVNDYKLIKEDEMLDIVALAQSGPGAMAISTSLLTGYKLRGPLGAITCLVASVLPCLIILGIISNYYKAFKANFYINAALKGIGGIVSAVLFVTVFNMGKTAYKKNPIFSSFVMLLVFIIGYFTSVNTALLILLSALFGLSYFCIDKMRRRKDV